ncbi:MAG: ATP-dependent helicase [Myxococcota bacterium]
MVAAGLDPRGPPGVSSARFLGLLGRAENDERPLEEVLLDHAPELQTLAGALETAADHYCRAKAEQRSVDFDDLLVLWRELLHPDQPSAKLLGASLDHVLVDEYQDTTPLQAELAEDLTRTGAHLFVVGDDAQCIYGFRGARFDNILEFPTRAPTEVHRLVTSYRSTPGIIGVARAALELNPLQFPKDLRSALPRGAPVEVHAAEDEAHEAGWVARRARELQASGVSWRDQAILVRRHRDASAFELALTEAGVPFTSRAGSRFFDRPHVADAVAHLRVILHPEDWTGWRRVLALRPGVGPVTTDRIVAALRDQEDPQAVLAQAVESSPGRAREGLVGLEPLLRRLAATLRGGVGPFFDALATDPDLGAKGVLARAQDERDAIDDLGRLAAFGGMSPEAFLDELAAGEEDRASEDDVLTLSTVHGAKGLEWNAVFVTGLCEGRFPSWAALRDPGGEAEERRLFYVAVTRAGRYLALTWPSRSPGERGAKIPSRFLEELPSELYFEPTSA